RKGIGQRLRDIRKPETIRKWENRTRGWLEVYDNGPVAREAQLHIQKFSSRKFGSHRRVREGKRVSMSARLDN
ncbi:hypothetical protein BDM02DRAFT_3105436, partial [Thelephora ganbajun]